MLNNKELKSADRFSFSWLIKLISVSLIIRSVFIFIAWVSVWQFGRLVEYTNHASVWFPPAGLTFSCMLVLGRKAIFPIMIGAILITLWNIDYYQIKLPLDEQFLAGFLFGLAHILPYWVGASVIVKVSKNIKNSIPKLIVTFLLIAALSTLIAALLVISSLVLTNQLGIEKVGETILPFWIGDMAGVVVLGPLFTAALYYLFPSSNINLNKFSSLSHGNNKSLYFKMSLNVILIFLTMLLAYVSKSKESAFAIFFLTVTHMWIASTESPLSNVVSLAFSSCMIVLLVHFFELMDYVMVYQFSLNVIGANALFGIAIPQLKAVNRDLIVQVNTDALTQVSTRQYLLQQAKIEIQKTHNNRSKLTLVVFDLDFFKKVNDKYGHSIGDLALKNVCATVNDFLNVDDVFARFGGDEFVLLLPKSSIEDARKLVEDIKFKIHQIKIEDERLSCSFGLAELQENEDFTQLFNRADKVLYQSKQSGGNTINLAM